MSRLLFVFERDMPTVSITRNMFTNLIEYPDIKADFMYLMDVKSKDIDSHDVIIFIRPDNDCSYKIAQKAHQSGHLVITFCDDDLMNLPKSMPSIPWRKRGLINTLSQSDVIWSTSKYILNKYRNYTNGKRVASVDTVVQNDDFDDISIGHSGEEVRIVYAAAHCHTELFEKYISPIVPKLIEEFEGKISFTFISAHPRIDGVKCEYYSGMPLAEYRQFMKDRHFDIGVAPLPYDEFSKCKYFNKFLEYSIQGVMGIYSNTEPYSYVVENGKNGLLVDNNTDSWHDALAMSIRDAQFRHECVSNAINYIKANHSEQSCMNRIINEIPEFLSGGNKYEKCSSFSSVFLKYYALRICDWIYLSFFYLRHLGIKGLLHKVNVHFAEIKAYKRKNNEKL